MTYSDILILAQPASEAAGEGASKPPPQSPLIILGYLAIVGFIFWYIVFRPRAKEKKKRDGMLGDLKKHDKVMTIGGIIGTVMEVRGDEIILKVDDSSNTRIKFMRGSIQKVVTQEEGPVSK